ncbi:MAG: TPM domain-containing protein [Clostridia bacterium]|nr:TPM domain-containing protein [Clostridia bacterium]
MKKMKFLALLLCTACLLSVFALFSFAQAPSRIVDSADLLDDAEEKQLAEMLDEVSDRLSFDVVVLTVEDTGGRDILVYADAYHESSAYRQDAAILVIDMYFREWCVATYGLGNEAVSQDATYEYLAPRFEEKLSDGNYFEAFTSYLSGCEKLVSEAQNGHPYEDWIIIPWGRNIFIALFVGLIIGLLAVTSMKSKLKSVKAARSAGNYVKKDSFTLTGQKDLFLFRTHTRTYSPQQKSSGGSRSGGGSRGGGRGRF